jgi:hypothetical protein
MIDRAKLLDSLTGQPSVKPFLTFVYPSLGIVPQRDRRRRIIVDYTF